MNVCQQCKQGFEIREWDKEFYEKIAVPFPKNCPECRMIRRFMERNPKTLYYRKCDLTGKQTLSQYHRNQSFPVYSPEAWWSDDWDALDRGRDFDFNKPFFEQFLELKNKTPHLALFNIVGTIENSDYNNCTGYLKNCYLIAESDYDEECYYSNLLKKCNFVVDCSVCYEDELCYECVDCTGCYNLLCSQDCQNCRDSYFLKNCTSCSDCIGCINQRQKQYMIFNKQHSKEEYEKLKAQFPLHATAGVEKLGEECSKFFLTQPRERVVAEQNENSIGDHLFNSKNAYHCFDCTDIEDCAYCAKLSLSVKSSMDYNSWGDKSELIYQSSGCGDNCYNLKFCTNCTTNMSNCEYCAGCFSCSDCFGCVGLKKQQYCILNKKYSKDEYHELKGKIIKYMQQTGEYGEFFPVDICPFGYNETMVMDAFPETVESAVSKGLKWYEEGQAGMKPQTSELLTCDCGRNYKIISQESDFYKKLQIPVPEKCPSCRHKARMTKRNPLKLWQRSCAKCGVGLESSYAPDRPEVVLCEKCYLKEVY
ncbi:MAG: hypothetical protein ABIH78_04695 [Candidatus Peregrinibacteria bacterium]